MKPATLRARIEELYRTACREESAHGALSWFARQGGVDPRTVTRWCKGERTPDGPVLALLACLEERYGLG